MKRYTKIRINEITLLLTIALLIFAICSNSIYAQQVLPGITVVPSKAPNTAVPPKIHAVKITSPAKGQKVPIGNNLVVSGTSSDDSNSNCQISVIVNGIKPYQPASASGSGGANDYSKWSIILSPKYTAIKKGENKITSSYICPSNPSLFVSDTVNVTGVAAVTQAATATVTATAASDNTATTINPTSSADNTTDNSGGSSSKHNSGDSHHSSNSSHDSGGCDHKNSSSSSDGGGGGSSSKHSSSSSSSGSHDSGGGKGGNSVSYYTYNDGSTQLVSYSDSSSHAFSNARSLSYYSYSDTSTQVASALHGSSKKQHSSSGSGSSDTPFKLPIPFP